MKSIFLKAKTWNRFIVAVLMAVAFCAVGSGTPSANAVEPQKIPVEEVSQIPTIDNFKYKWMFDRQECIKRFRGKGPFICQ